MVVMRVPLWMSVKPGPTIREGAATAQVALAPLPRVVLLTCLLACLLTGAALTGVAHGEPAWTTYHRDPERSGDDPDATEPIAPVLAWHTPSLGAPIWGQPLVLGSHVYVATVGDEIYELNATTGAVEWQQNAGTPVPSEELPCGDITPTVGIVGTPVIDTSTGAIYAVADTWNASTHEAEHVLKGYRLSDGEQVLSTPVDPPGSYHRAFLQRTALNLDDGNVIFGFGGNDGDCSEYRGTVVAAPENGGAPRSWQVPIEPPAEWGGAVWAPSGPTVDGEGNVYATTGNPDPPDGDELNTYDYSDSVLKLGLADFVADPLTEQGPPLGWFEPSSWKHESENDLDLSSADAELLPGGLLFQAGKGGVGYLIDEAGMNTGAPAVFSHEVCGGHGSFGGDAYASGAVSATDPTATGTIYIACTNGTQALAYNDAGPTGPSFTPLWQGPADAFGPPIVSGGLVWVVATGGFSGGGTTLYGLDSATGVPTYTETLPSPVTDHFASPSAAGGRLFVSTGSSVTAYQIAQLPPGGTTSPSPPAPVFKVGAKASLVPTLLHKHLRADRKGRVRVALRCPAAAGTCKGTVTLVAEIATIVHRGERRVRRVVPVGLARARYGPHKGDFTVVLRLSLSARARLHRHHDRLNLLVVIVSGGGTRRVGAVLR